MRRRQLLATCSTSLTVGIAGCNSVIPSGDGESESTPTEDIEAADSGPPYFENVRISGPDSAPVGRPFSITITAANTGGRTGDFTATLTQGESVLSTETGVKIEEIEPGTRKSTTIDGIVPQYARTTEFKITDYAASHSVEFRPRQLQAGETVEIQDGVSITVSFESLETGLLYTTEIPSYDGQVTVHHVADPSPDGLYAVLYAEIQNDSDEEFSFSPDFDFPMDINDWTDPALQGSRAHGLTVPPGQSANGWILKEVAPEEISNGASFEYNKALTDTPEFKWQIPTDVDVPQFEIETVEIPESLQIGQEGTAEFAVRNKGTGESRFRAVVKRRNATGEDGWNSVAVINQLLAQGETKTFEIEISEPFLGPSEYGIEPLEITQTVDFTPARRQFGESYSLLDRTKYELSFLEFSDSYQFDNGFENETIEADGTFAILGARCTNMRDEIAMMPEASEFTAVVNGQEYTPSKPDSFQPEMASPYSASFYTAGLGTEAGNSKAGLLVYDVPASTTREELSVKLNIENETISFNESGSWKAKVFWN